MAAERGKVHWAKSRQIFCGWISVALCIGRPTVHMTVFRRRLTCRRCRSKLRAGIGGGNG